MSGNTCSILNEMTCNNYTVPVILSCYTYTVVYIVPPVSCAHLEISQQHIKVEIYLKSIEQHCSTNLNSLVNIKHIHYVYNIMNPF